MPSPSKDKLVIELLREAWDHVERNGGEPAGGVLSVDMADMLLEQSPDEVTLNPDNVDEFYVDGKPIKIITTGATNDSEPL